MCNLNILFINKTNPEVVNKVVAFMQSVSSNSYASNRDGDGVYLSKGKLIKSGNKLNYFNYKKDFVGSKTIISHQRIATSGFTSEYLQPFSDGEFVLAHNGVIPLNRDNHSDTYVLMKQFLKNFNGLPKEYDREKRIRMSLKSVINSLNSGSYSIILYDKVTKLSYYFKNMERSIYAYKTDNFLYLTTASENKVFLSLLQEEETVKSILSDKLYRISGLEMEIIDDIGRKRTEVQSNLSSMGFSGYRISVPKATSKKEVESSQTTDCGETDCGITDFDTYDMFKDRLSSTRFVGRCHLCSMWTGQKDNYKDEYICEDCVEEIKTERIPYA